MKADIFINKFKDYLLVQIDNMAASSPVVSIMKPLITRIMSNNFSKITGLLGLVADDNGEIDVQGILTEMADNLMSVKPFDINVRYLGDIEIGGGAINIPIPYTDKVFKFTSDDLKSLNESLLNNKEYGRSSIVEVSER